MITAISGRYYAISQPLQYHMVITLKVSSITNTGIITNIHTKIIVIIIIIIIIIVVVITIDIIRWL